MKKIKKYLPVYLLAFPGFLYLLINNYIPMGGLVIAFKDINWQKGIWGSDWAGLKNFEYLFKTPDAFNITRNTICYNVVFILVNMVVALLYAILLNEIRNKLMVKFCQTTIMLPFMISMVIVSYLGYAFLAGDNGMINGVLARLGMEPVNWYSEPKYWPVILVVINCWKGVGYGTIVYLSSILGIDQELYEAAAVDGIHELQKIRYITLPLIKPTIITLVLLNIGRIFYSDFGLFYQVPMSSGALIDATSTIDTYVYRGLITLGDVGMSSAAGFYQSMVGFILILAANAIIRKFSEENALF